MFPNSRKSSFHPIGIGLLLGLQIGCLGGGGLESSESTSSTSNAEDSNNLDNCSNSEGSQNVVRDLPEAD
jgi:hypothetical protein